MIHYVCPGECGGEADSPGVCQAEDCSRESKPLAACNCEDGEHDPVSENEDRKEVGTHEELNN